ncbi:MAG: metallophosphoesterase [Bacteroidetes bacterium]|nr:metallophosphoesterase [Bacteroidota bacterium]
MKIVLVRSNFLVMFSLILITFSSCSPASLFDSPSGKSEVIDQQPTPEWTFPNPPASEKRITFLAVGDAGTGEDAQKIVASGMAHSAENRKAGFVLYLGDNFYESGVSSVSDPLWQTAFETVYNQSSLQIPFYAILGNHDYYGNEEAELEYALSHDRWKMPARYYSFSAGISPGDSIDFFALDTEMLLDETSDEAKAQLVWLDAELKQSSAIWKVVFGHHPVRSNGEHGNTGELVALLKPILEENKVTAYFCGHDHHLELIKPENGVNYIVSGAGGKRRNVTWRKNTKFASTNFGFVSVEASATYFAVTFHARFGNVIYSEVIGKK